MVWSASYRSDGSGDGLAKIKNSAKRMLPSEAGLMILETQTASERRSGRAE